MGKGVIGKSLSGFYYVRDGEKTVSCRARGSFRHEGMSPLVGDSVEYTETRPGHGVIDCVLERRNSFIRPAVANVDTVVFVASAAKPVTEPFLIDRVSVIAEKAGCGFLLLLNKSDIVRAQELYDMYSSIGIETILTSAETGEGKQELRKALEGKICVFTGNSGVGKSSLINSLIPDAEIETDEISEKLGRGKHTTRHVELYSAGNETYIADTPGFASFDIRMIDNICISELQTLFTEFSVCGVSCRFCDCVHLNEPGCAVREAVERGEIPLSRYESYKKMFEMLKDCTAW